jgi:hypothetical protein
VARICDSAVPPDLLATLTLEQALDGVHLRLQPRSAVPWPEHVSYARPIGEDLLEILMWKWRDALVTLTDDVVARLGSEALRAAGLANLVASPFGEWARHPLTGGGEVIVVRGDSGFTASRALVVPDVLRRTIGGGEEIPLPHGALVCLPDRHTLGLHPLGHRNVLRAVSWLTLLGLDDFPCAPYPASPHLHWWHDGVLEQVSSSDPAGFVVHHRGGAWEEALVAVLGEPLDAALDRVGP